MDLARFSSEQVEESLYRDQKDQSRRIHWSASRKVIFHTERFPAALINWLRSSALQARVLAHRGARREGLGPMFNRSAQSTSGI